MNLEGLTEDARIIAGIVAGVLGGGMLLMIILGFRGAGRKRLVATELSWPHGGGDEPDPPPDQDGWQEADL